jgi:hypothetical protein
MDEKAQAFQEFERSGWNEVASAYADLSDGTTSQVAETLLDAVGAGAGCACSTSPADLGGPQPRRRHAVPS